VSSGNGAISPVRAFTWALRRELWESRSIYIAPVAVSIVFFIGFVIRLLRLASPLHGAAIDSAAITHAFMQATDFGAALLMATTMIVGAYYCVDALYGERRDRSVLFWKSMPVSDTSTVLAKITVPVIVLPLLAFVTAVAFDLLMLVVSSVVVVIRGGSAAGLWSVLSPSDVLMLLYHFITVHSLGPAPVYAWVLMVSAWARRVPLVWAFVPPIALAYLEKISFNTTYFGNALMRRFAGNGTEGYMAAGASPLHGMTHATPLRYLTSPGLLVGMLVTAAFLMAAIYLRRRSEPI
jgi:ABC-2 type transport system permease protein